MITDDLPLACYASNTHKHFMLSIIIAMVPYDCGMCHLLFHYDILHCDSRGPYYAHVEQDLISNYCTF